MVPRLSLGVTYPTCLRMGGSERFPPVGSGRPAIHIMLHPGVTPSPPHAPQHLASQGFWLKVALWQGTLGCIMGDIGLWLALAMLLTISLVITSLPCVMGHFEHRG